VVLIGLHDEEEVAILGRIVRQCGAYHLAGGKKRRQRNRKGRYQSSTNREIKGARLNLRERTGFQCPGKRRKIKKDERKHSSC